MTDRHPPDDLEVLSEGLRHLQRTLASRSVHGRLVDAAGVEVSQQAVQVLSALADGAAASAGAVARRAGMDLGAASRQFKALEEAGHLVRRADPDAGRVVLVELTPSGRALADRIRSVRRAHLRSALADWAPTDRRQLGEWLLRLVDDLQATAYRRPPEADDHGRGSGGREGEGPT